MALLLALVFATQVSPCTGSRLNATFTAIRGSQGAGNIVYTLRLKNRSTHECWVSGLPQVTLLGKTGKKLPTHGRAEFPGEATAVIVRLAPGKSATANARFSPDVPGVGEGHPGQCEPTAYSLLVRPNGGGTVRAPVSPATPVCEHGQLSWSLLSAAH